MELLKLISNNDEKLFVSLPNNKWTQSIQSNPSNQSNQSNQSNKRRYYSLETLLINTFDINSLNEYDDMFYNQKKIEYSSNIDNEDYYNKFNYSNKLSIKTIQKGLYEKNQLSNIIFLCDLFKVCLYINYKNNLYKVGIKNEHNPLLVNFDKKWIINNNTELLNKPIQKISELKDIINFNIHVTDNSVNIPCTLYKSSLNSITKYKLADLINLAEQNNIQLTIKNKKKTKQMLYNELYLKLI